MLDEVGIGAERRMQLRKFSKGMLQRVGLAQALINDPELVILDEPMSGLDPIGRRDVRSLILRLGERGCTVFFSSHVLSDAEALCSRVAILSRGRLVTAGKLTDMLAFQVRGWELVATHVTETLARSLEVRARRIARLSEGRFAIELPLDPSPDRLLAELAAAGARLVSLNPIRETLEDFFVHQIEQAESTARPREHHDDRRRGGAA
jgi:ABC-2 type transport system ATP-binding protein